MIDLNAMVGEVMKYGFPGVVIIILAYVIIQMRKEYKADLAAKDAEIKAERDRADGLQEKRIAESRETMAALNASSNVLEDVLKAVTAIAAKDSKAV